MSRLRNLAFRRIGNERMDARVAQLACFAAGPAVLILAAHALRRHAATPGEVVVGLLAALAVSLLCIILGLLLPMTQRRNAP